MTATTILPTRTCFDDAVEILAMFIKADQDFENTRVVHALVESNEPGHEGKIISHGWLEYRDMVIFRGIVDGKTIELSANRREYYKNSKVKQIIRYTPLEVLQHNRRTGHTGPWDELFTPYTRQGYERQNETRDH